MVNPLESRSCVANYPHQVSATEPTDEPLCLPPCDPCCLSLPSYRQARLPDPPQASILVCQPAPAAGVGASRAQAEAISLLAQPQPTGTFPEVSQHLSDNLTALGGASLPLRPTPSRPLPGLQSGSERVKHQSCIKSGSRLWPLPHC